jgi:multiple sugar transport system permease protein
VRSSVNTKTAVKVVSFVLLLIAVFLIDLPFIAQIGNSLKGSSEILANPGLLPRALSLENYAYVLTRSQFGLQLVNSLVNSGAATLFTIVFASLGGYVVSRFQGKVFTAYAVSLQVLIFFPFIMMLIPMFMLFKTLRLLNTPYSVIIAYVALNLPVSIWLQKAFFDSIPKELEESAMVDGCGHLRALFDIVVPLSLPGVATVAIFSFVRAWNDFMLASVFLRDTEVMTLTLGLQQFSEQNYVNWGGLAAASTLAMLPTLVFMLAAQKYLIQGLTAGAVKG